MKKLKHILRRRKKTILISFVFLFLPAAAAAIILPSIYTSQTTIRVNNRTPESINLQLLSRNHLLNIIARLNLYPELRSRYSSEQIVEKMKRDIHFEVIDKTTPPASFTFILTYKGTDPPAVNKTLDALTELYIKENRTIETPDNRRHKDAVARLEQETTALKAKIKEIQIKIIVLKKEIAGELPEHIRLNQGTLVRLKQEIKGIDSRILRLKQQKIKLQTQLASTSPMSREAQRKIKIAERPLNKLRDKLADLESRLTDSHPDLVKLKQKIQLKEKEVQEVIRTAQKDKDNRSYLRLKDRIESTEFELTNLKSAKKAAQKEIALSRKKIANAMTTENQLNTFNFELQEATSRYQEASARLSDARNALKTATAQRIAEPQITVIDPAHPLDLSPQPDRLMMILAGFSLFVLIGSGMAFLKERFDTTVKSINQLKSISNLPVLSALPKVTSKSERRTRRFKTFLKLLFLLGIIAGALSYVDSNLTPLRHLLVLVQTELTMVM